MINMDKLIIVSYNNYCRGTPGNVLLWAGHMVGFVLCGENHLDPLSP